MAIEDGVQHEPRGKRYRGHPVITPQEAVGFTVTHDREGSPYLTDVTVSIADANGVACEHAVVHVLYTADPR